MTSGAEPAGWVGLLPVVVGQQGEIHERSNRFCPSGIAVVLRRT
jgi:hypothetical protein